MKNKKHHAVGAFPKSNTVKPAHVVTSIKQLPVLKGHLCLVLS